MYRFTRAWGSVTAALGWVILVGTPSLFVAAAALAIHDPSQFPQAWPLVHPDLFMAFALVLGLVLGVAGGGGFIVAGQLLKIAVDTVNIQAGMLDRLQRLTALATTRPGEAPGGRFSGLAGE
jgi:hypothetical protein